LVKVVFFKIKFRARTEFERQNEARLQLWHRRCILGKKPSSLLPTRCQIQMGGCRSWWNL